MGFSCFLKITLLPGVGAHAGLPSSQEGSTELLQLRAWATQRDPASKPTESAFVDQ